MIENLTNWTPRAWPQRIVLEGRYARLEPLDAARHGDDLFVAATAGDAETRFRWLVETPPADRATFETWLQEAQSASDALFHAVVDKATGRAVGRQKIMRIDQANGVIELGGIHWGPEMQRSRVSTEAQFLVAAHVFDDLGYLRYEWKCDNRNEPSKRAALRFGFVFEGLFRQHMIVKGTSRDTAWYSIVNGEWPALRAAYERWLDPSNFDGDGRQKVRLEEMIASRALSA